MGTFALWLRGLFTGPAEEGVLNEITSEQEWEALLKRSEESPVFVFKHSTTCPISAGAYKRVLDYEKEHENLPEIAMVKVIESRPVSNAIAEAVKVQHQSPQMILLKDGKAVWDASHGGIYGGAIDEALKAHGG